MATNGAGEAPLKGKADAAKRPAAAAAFQFSENSYGTSAPIPPPARGRARRTPPPPHRRP